MSIVQSESEFIDMAHEVGIYDPRASEMWNVANIVDVTSTDEMSVVVNAAGYYDEKADQLEAVGMTYAI